MQKDNAKPRKRRRSTCDADTGIANASRGPRECPTKGSLLSHSDEVEAFAPEFPIEVCVESSYSTDAGCKATVDIVYIIKKEREK